MVTVFKHNGLVTVLKASAQLLRAVTAYQPLACTEVGAQVVVVVMGVLGDKGRGVGIGEALTLVLAA